MSNPQRTVFITGCSDGGLGAHLALAFHKAGFKVYASARNPKKLGQVESAGIETLTLDVLSDESIKNAIAQLPRLDILVNNAGAQTLAPVSDIDIPAAKKLFDLNLWSYIAVIQAALPLLLKSSYGGLIVNQTSIAGVVTMPFQAVYSASKVAITAVTNTLRIEMEAFGIKVVDLKTGVVRSNLIGNLKEATPNKLDSGSIWLPAKDIVEKALSQEAFAGAGLETKDWAESVVGDLLKKNPPKAIWRGESSFLARVIGILPLGMFDGMLKKIVGLDQAEKILKHEGVR